MAVNSIAIHGNDVETLNFTGRKKTQNETKSFHNNLKAPALAAVISMFAPQIQAMPNNNIEDFENIECVTSLENPEKVIDKETFKRKIGHRALKESVKLYSSDGNDDTVERVEILLKDLSGGVIHYDSIEAIVAKKVSDAYTAYYVIGKGTETLKDVPYSVETDKLVKRIRCSDLVDYLLDLAYDSKRNNGALNPEIVWIKDDNYEFPNEAQIKEVYNEFITNYMCEK